jgi:pimeloyl-ACP methyl ester carboxylesterase
VRASWFNAPQGSERLYVLEAGERRPDTPTLVLFHGVGEIGTGDYYPVLKELARVRHVLAVDLPGFGRSDPRDDDYGPERLVSAVRTVVDVCAARSLEVLGHSSGAALALLFAADHEPKVRRIILVDAAGILRPEVLLRGQLHQALTPMRKKVPGASKAVQAVGGALIQAVQGLVPNAKAIAETGLLGDSPSVRAATALLDYNFGYAIERVRSPTLILWGEEDQVAPPRIAHLLDDRIADSELSFIEKGGHVLMKDQPKEMAEAAVRFLTEPHTRSESQEPASRSNQGRAQCKDRDEQTFEGAYDAIDIVNCKKFRLLRVHAKEVRVSGSEGRIDESRLGALHVVDSEVSLTAGEVRGDIAVVAKESKLDIAATRIVGKEVALRLDEDSEAILSITRLESPLTNSILHEQIEPEESRDF